MGKLTRSSRIESIKKILIDADAAMLEISKEKLVNGLCLDWCATRRTILEYLNVLIANNLVIEEKRGKEVLVSWKKQ